MFIQSTNKKFNNFLANISAQFDMSNKSIHNARNEIKIINFQNEKLVVKSFREPNLINKIIYTFFRDSKAKKSYNYSLRISNFVPEAIGYVEYTKYFLLSKSYFVSKHFDYSFTIREPLLDDSFVQKEEILRAFARFTYELHQNNIFHYDYSPGNILIKKTDNKQFVFKIVDINRMGFKPLNIEDRAKNFSKLWARDDELAIITNEYVKYSLDDEELFRKKVLYFSHKNKQIKNFKKRLKGKNINQ